MRVISEHYSMDKANRKAIVEEWNGHYAVAFFENDELISTETYHDKNLQYHEDAAENYVLGVKKISKTA